MKLIIDIDENSYKTCKSLAPLTNDYIDTVIANGILYEERPQGEWIHKEFDPFLKEYGQCSNCLQRERVGNFCRNCGADMRGEKKCR